MGRILFSFPVSQLFGTQIAIFAFRLEWQSPRPGHGGLEKNTVGLMDDGEER